MLEDTNSLDGAHLSLFMPYVNNKGTDQSLHPRSMVSTFVVGCLDSMMPILAKPKFSRLKPVSVAEQAGLGLTWSQT